MRHGFNKPMFCPNGKIWPLSSRTALTNINISAFRALGSTDKTCGDQEKGGEEEA